MRAPLPSDAAGATKPTDSAPGPGNAETIRVRPALRLTRAFSSELVRLSDCYVGTAGSFGPRSQRDGIHSAEHGSATRRMAQLPGLLSGTAIEAPGRTLSEPDLRAALEAPDRLVPTTTGGHLADL